MSEELQRRIGELLARVTNLEKTQARIVSLHVAVGLGAAGVVAVFILKQAGLM